MTLLLLLNLGSGLLLWVLSLPLLWGNPPQRVLRLPNHGRSTRTQPSVRNDSPRETRPETAPCPVTHLPIARIPPYSPGAWRARPGSGAMVIVAHRAEVPVQGLILANRAGNRLW